MKRTVLSLLVAAAALMLPSCGDSPLDYAGMIRGQGPATDERFEDSMEADRKTGNRPLTLAESGYRVYVGADMHIDSLECTAHTDAFLSAFRSDDDAPFALILGDIVNGRDGIEDISAHIRSAAGPKADALYITVGNHDIYFGLWERWYAQWGSSVYSFEVRTPGGTDFFLCLDSAAGTMGRSQMEWLRKALEDASRKDYRHRVVFTHTHMFKKDGSQGHTSNYAMEETLELTGLLTRHGVGMYIAGHDHSREITRLGGVDYITVDALEESAGDPAYMVLNMGELMTFDFVEIM